MPKHSWKLQAAIRSAIPVAIPGQTVCFKRQGIQILFEPVAFHENYVWPGYSSVIPQRAWDYALTIEGLEEKPNAGEVAKDAWAALDRITASLSFGLSAPVILLNHGSVTNAPVKPVSGEEYTTLVRSRETAAEITPQEKYGPNLIKEACVTGLINGGMERVHRSMRWLQQSYYVQTPVEEFICIMIGLEAISGHLGDPPLHRWRCGTCHAETPSCPSCGAPTGRAGTGEASLRRFVCSQLAWPLEEWKAAWKLRNKLIHGHEDVSGSELNRVLSALPRIEHALVSALRCILRLPTNAPPRRLRDRNPFYEAVLHMEWRA